MIDRPNLITRIVAAIGLSVRSKMLFAFLGITCLLVGLALFGLSSLQQANKRTEAMVGDQERFALLSEAYGYVGDLQTLALAASIDPEGINESDTASEFASGSRAQSRVQDLVGFLGRNIRSVGGPETPDGKVISRVRDMAKSLQPIAARLRELNHNGDFAAVQRVAVIEFVPIARKMQRELFTRMQEVEQELAARAETTARSYVTSRQNIMAAAMAAIGVALLLGYSLSSSLLWPIDRTRQALGRIAGGDFDIRVSVPNRDELGELADHVNETSKRLDTLYSKVEAQRAELAAEHARSEALLYNLLPEDIAKRLKLEPHRTIADSLPNVAILFADIVDFTPRASKLPPEDVVRFLNKVFSAFDLLAQKHGLEKIKTIGDAYMVAAGMPNPVGDPVKRVAEMAMDMKRSVAQMSADFPDGLQVRIGLHAGPAVAGVIGNRKLFYDVWGETVNTASRMESHGEPGRIQVTEAAKAELDEHYEFEPRGTVEVKGVGEVETWWLIGKRASA